VAYFLVHSVVHVDIVAATGLRLIFEYGTVITPD